METTLDEFTRAYLSCALWSTNDNANEQGGEPLDANYSVHDIAPEALARMLADCKGFQQLFADMLSRAYAAGSDAGQAGHDFWLTRNGHGAGFWDRGLGQVGEELTTVAKLYKEFELYVGDDKKIHV